MNAEQAGEKAQEVLLQYETLQQKHLLMLEESLQTVDIEMMHKERTAIFADLKKHLEFFARTATTDTVNSAKDIEKRISTIMEIDQQLADGIKEYKNGINDRMKTVQHGKKAMAGYKHNFGNQNRPAVLSMNR